MTLEWRHNLEHHSRAVINGHNMFTESSITFVIMFMVQAAVAKIINYDRNMSIVQVTPQLSNNSQTYYIMPMGASFKELNL